MTLKRFLISILVFLFGALASLFAVLVYVTHKARDLGAGVGFNPLLFAIEIAVPVGLGLVLVYWLVIVLRSRTA